jgi:NADPH:quinone reductase-like Zn-dependent oxidoreductase
MKAAYINQLGAPENILFGDLPKPSIGDTDVLVEVSYAAVNNDDLLVRSGRFPIAKPAPYIIGRTMCGVVRATGRRTTRFMIGERVWSDLLGIHGRQGVCAQYVSADETLLNRLPKTLDEKKTVAFVHSGLIVCLGMLTYGKLGAGESIFIHGASGNIGSAAIQVAKTMGSTVIATAGTQEKVEWCRMLGAAYVYNFTKPDYSKDILKVIPEGVDVYWDLTNEPNLERALLFMRPGGRILLMSNLDLHPALPLKALCWKDCTVKGFNSLNANPEEYNSYGDVICQMLEKGLVKVHIARTFPLQEVGEAHRLLESANPPQSGKILISV